VCISEANFHVDGKECLEKTHPMINLRRYGKPPYAVAVVHGGPGARGEVAPVARELSRFIGILEPLQTATTLEGQVSELHRVLQENASLPVTLIGHSWGAWLSFIAAARYPAFVKKLVLVGSGPLEPQYAAHITETRLTRLSENDRSRALSLIKALSGPGAENKNKLLGEFGAICARADAYDPLPDDGNELFEVRHDANELVWEGAEALRRSGELLEMGKQITCPVVAIHGDYDSHPAKGVERPLSRVLREFRFILLEKCGHSPWLERQARERFYRTLMNEIECQRAPSQGVNDP
jgi:pimeloyl-ACP methyl ester carboxylesterase